MKLKLLSKRQELGDIWTFVFETPEKFKWLPGQYMFYNLPHKHMDAEGDTRYFTISAAPYEKNVSITTRITQSTFKQALSKMEVGDAIDASGPDGGFTLKPDTTNYIFIAGGIGITPFRSILLQLKNENRMENIKLIYANKTNNIFLKDDLDALVAKYPNFLIEYVVDPARVDKNYLMDNIEKDTYYYVSGPEPMAKGLTQILLELNVDKKYIVKDYFPGYENY